MTIKFLSFRRGLLITVSVFLIISTIVAIPLKAKKEKCEGTSVTIQVKYADGKPVPGATIDIYDSSGEWIEGGTTNKRGKYSTCLPIGDYYAIVQDDVRKDFQVRKKPIRVLITLLTCTDADGDNYAIEGGDCGLIDCDDTNPSIYPGATEVCDGVDNDCNGEIDGITESCYTGPPETLDVGVCISGTRTCESGVWGDCIGEVTPTDEVCDGLDNDCDGSADEDLTEACGSGGCSGTKVCTAGIWSDCSSSGADCGTCCICDASGTETYDQLQDSDCSATVCPFDVCGGNGCGPNIWCDYPIEVSNECSGLFTCTVYSCDDYATCEDDYDVDGYSPTCGDCDDTNPNIHPGATEVCNDTIDNDCDYLIDADDPDCVCTESDCVKVTVYKNGSPLEGATVTILGTLYETTTGPDGVADFGCGILQPSTSYKAHIQKPSELIDHTENFMTNCAGGANVIVDL